MVLSERISLLKKGSGGHGPVVYWMSRDQRAEDNWALLFALQEAQSLKRPVLVIFIMANDCPDATWRQIQFMLNGLKETERRLFELNIPFLLLPGNPLEVIPALLYESDAAILITDFDPLRPKRIWKEQLITLVNIPFYEVDAHNIVPCTYCSNKEEFAAYTIRPKIRRKLNRFLDPYPPLTGQPKQHLGPMAKTDWEAIGQKFSPSEAEKQSMAFDAGYNNGMGLLDKFLREKLGSYSLLRNDPNAAAQSGLSPYLHFGQISAQRVVLEVIIRTPHNENRDAFLDEIVVRRELSDNFCWYNSHYDKVDGFRPWAKKTLSEHRRDEREFLYTHEQFEEAKTHDNLWNAAQSEMVFSGKMHGFMRMYWAKKILEWSVAPEEALQTAILLNDRYELDGHDPNGYAGCAWSIGGTHDRAWFDRAVFGKIRYMNRNGCNRKFDVDQYINRVNQIVR